MIDENRPRATNHRLHATRLGSATVASRLLLCFVSGVGISWAEERAPTLIKTERFDRDPGWEGRKNRIAPKEYPTVVQAFGYRKTNFAGAAAGELGGQVWRASEPAYYGDKIGPKTLDDKLSASGTFAVTKTSPGSGVFFGFFRAEQPGAGGRPIGSLGMDLDCEHSGARLAVRLITSQNQSCGTFITPFIPGKFRPTPLKNDGTRYTWRLDYDPDAADGRGQVTFLIRGDAESSLDQPDLPEAHQQEARTHFPSQTTFTVDLPEGYKQQGTTFDHFGLMNMMKAGGQLNIYFDDLEYEGRSQDFSQDPHWDASGNRVTYQATDVAGAHSFGFSPTHHAGGQLGEVGGTFWRTDNWGYYADKVGPLSFADRLEARGRVVCVVGGPDSDMCFGWFRSGNSGAAPNKAGNYLGIKVGGPTRVGHYFLPAFTVNEQVRGLPDKGPVLRPGKTYEWSLVYDPAANDGQGSITATLGDESITLKVNQGKRFKAEEARLDRFGLFSIGPGGQIAKLYLDDLEYTAGHRSLPAHVSGQGSSGGIRGKP